jgi:hypothetical protein
MYSPYCSIINLEGYLNFFISKDKLQDTTKYLPSIDISLMFIFSNTILEIQNLVATFIDDDIFIRLAGFATTYSLA